MKNKNIQKLSFVGSSILMATNVLPLGIVFAASNTKDSIASVNTSDDGTNVGVDITQSQKTEYSGEITADSQEAAKVYVSQASTFGVVIPKVIILDGAKNDEGINKANYVVTLIDETNIGGTEKVSVVPDTSFKMSQEGKDDIDVTVSQDKEEWSFNEVDVVGNGEIAATGMSAGMWKGEFNFDIKLVANNNSTPQETSAGLYDENGNLVVDWNTAGIDLMTSNSASAVLANYPTVTKIIIPDEAFMITSYVFANCPQLEEIVVPDSVSIIYMGAFDGVKHVTYNGSAMDENGDNWGALALN